ncbi:ATP-dependent nuclease subunit B [Streptococcus porci]|uniref:ATP-dependent nuclease subunit B n=1 Tax=Streptococcus porci TaxID=502567 RepID=UPI000489D589|nr:ATP-dependent nuclease subunit B [Streptococcus porci]
MKLLYTAIKQDLTVVLAKEAEQYAKDSKRVFYISPNSLSFEKEKKVLKNLGQGASFRITVTRFGQMARYFLLNSRAPKDSLDETGLSMIFYRALSGLSEADLQVYGKLRKDNHFIKQLVDLYQEMKSANMSLSDLEHLDSPAKRTDLVAIFSAVEELLRRHSFDSQSKLSYFTTEIKSGALDKELAETVVIIDGFSRFSAEEFLLIQLLHEKGVEIVIGAYMSQKAYSSNFSAGNIYQASIDFIRSLAKTYAVKPIYVSAEHLPETAFSRLSRLVEHQHDFTETEEKLSDEDKMAISIWEVVNQREEITQVAKRIRYLLANGVRYKDIWVLLGDVETYHLQVSRIFQKFDIPFYIAKSESMSTHLLVNVIDALTRLKRYNYRAEDLLNLLKSGLFGNFSQKAIDRFEQYVLYADIKGFAKFNRDFTANVLVRTVTGEDGEKTENYRYDLDSLNAMRNQIMLALSGLLSAKKQKGKNLLVKLSHFLKSIQLMENLSQMTEEVGQKELDQYEQVWTVFTKILSQMQTIFGEEVLSVEEFLSLINSGMMAAQYRTVPATVDVVTVKSYDLIEPHMAPYIFAIGLSQNHFPKIAVNKSLLSDQERSHLNEKTADASTFDIVSRDNLKKNHFTALSLYNSATKELVLSSPLLAGENSQDLSSYLKELKALGVPSYERGLHFEAKGEAIGHYKDVLATALAINRGEMDRELTQEEQTFWKVAVRFLRKKLDEKAVLVPHILDEVKTKRVSPEVMEVRFPLEEPIRLSISGLSTYYNNQYLYFVRYILKLEEKSSIHPDASIHGQYLHRVFERLLSQSPDSAHFDEFLEKAIADTNRENSFAFMYNSEDQESQLARSILEDVARATASLFKNEQERGILSQEERFHFNLGKEVQVNGIIDRVDRLADGSLGVVDYKSSETKFDLERFYNGLNSQLVTYLQALKEGYGIDTDQLFGAMYLHMKSPSVKMADLKSPDDILKQNLTSLTYQGLFAEGEKEHLADGFYKTTNNLYDKAELDTLLAYNQELFQSAVRGIRSGSFAINPYTADLKSVQGEQLKNITHFEADRHMLTHARRLEKLPRKGRTIDRMQAFALLAGEEKEDEH